MCDSSTDSFPFAWCLQCSQFSHGVVMSPVCSIEALGPISIPRLDNTKTRDDESTRSPNKVWNQGNPIELLLNHWNWICNTSGSITYHLIWFYDMARLQTMWQCGINKHITAHPIKPKPRCQTNAAQNNCSCQWPQWPQIYSITLP